MRDDAFFYQNQTMQGRGLIPIQLNPALKPGASASLMANVYEHLNKLNGNNEIENLDYSADLNDMPMPNNVFLI